MNLQHDFFEENYDDYAKGGTSFDVLKYRKDFVKFVDEYDKRRGKDFCKTFPELAVWYEQIEVDDTIPNVPMKPGDITHFEDGVYNSIINNSQ